MLPRKSSPPSPLTPLEKRLMCLLAQGSQPAQAALTLRLEPQEAQRILANLMQQNGVTQFRQLLVRALVHGWLRN